MVEKVIVIKADTSDAVKGIDDVSDAYKGVEKSAESAEKAVDDVGDTAKKQTKVVKGLGNSVKLVGTALKALGIGIIIALVAKLTDVFSKNQKVIDFVSTTLDTVGIVFNQVADAIISTYEAVASSTENFDALGKVIKSLLTIAITPLKLSFFAIKLGIQEAQLVWEKSFFGDKNPITIKELNEAIKETRDDIIGVAVDVAVAGKSIINNFGEAITEISNIGTVAVENLSKVSLTAAIEQAKTLTELNNAAQLAAAQQGRLVEQYDRLAERQRQIRDDESISIKERQAANLKLGEILEQQEIAMIKQADLQVAAAAQQVKINDNIENQVALTEALANKEGVLAAVEGFRSEQIVNRIALKKEEIELDTSINEAEKERQLAQLEFEAEQAETEAGKLDLLREKLELENEIIAEDLERKRELFSEGTQARVDAEQEYLTQKQEIDNQLIANENARANSEIEIEEKVAKSKNDIRAAQLNNISSGISLIASLSKKSRTLQAASIIAENAVGIAKTIISTQAANAGALATPQAILTSGASAIPVIAANKVNAGISIATSIAAAAKGLSALKAGGSPTGGSADSSGAPTTAPSFNLVEGSGTNQIAEGLQTQQQPIQAVVVSGDVTTAQSVDRNIVENSTI